MVTDIEHYLAYDSVQKPLALNEVQLKMERLRGDQHMLTS